VLIVLRRALALRDSGDVAAARRSFEAAGRLLPAFGDWAQLLAADAVARSGDTAAVRALLATSAAELARDRGWRAHVRAHREARDLAGAARAAAAARPEPAAERVDRFVTLGELRLRLGDADGARAAFRLAADSFPGAVRTVDAARALAAAPGRTLDDQARIGRVYLRHGNLPRALAALDAYLEGRGGTADERNALRLEIGQALFARGELANAERRMLRLAALQIAPELAAEALLVAGRAQYRAGRETVGRATLTRAVDRVGGTGRIAAEALFVLADMAHDDGAVDAARDYYRRASAADPTSARGHEAAVRFAAIAYLRGELTAAAAAFAAAPATGPRRQRLDYWAALSHRSLGDSARAETLLRVVLSADPLSYYGMRAAERLGAPPPRPPSGPADDELNRTRVHNALVRYDVLRALGLNDAASYEMDRVQRAYTQERAFNYALAEALHVRGEHLRAIRLGRELERTTTARDERLLRIINPFPYRDAITREARRHGLDPSFVAALIRQESLFNPAAKSGAGAIGLMQVMPRSGAAVARRLGIGSFKPAMLTDPEINLRIGTVILADHLRNYGNRVPDVLIAYNAGAGRLARWRALPEREFAELFVERIPYEETRDYVRIVQTNAYTYRALYGE
jgi:soluble lytic murein transglycosylase